MLFSCNKKDVSKNIQSSVEDTTVVIAVDTIVNDTEEYFLEKRQPFILADIDGDSKCDSIIIIKDKDSQKEGLRIVYANKKIDTLGIWSNVAGQNFDDISWAGIFKKAPKGNRYANNVDENWLIITDEEILPEDWIILPNDGIYLHMDESCGGGVIYLEDNEYKWIQQE